MQSKKITLTQMSFFKEHLITVTDKAGNVSQMTVYAIRSGSFSFDALTLYLNGKEIAPNENGEKK
ncbi:MAG: hypothetical protein L6V93_22885 [Clostridiales bacterium]|nr:MAG: hypothetical protein L6V93_22885 [Clostridiales bacterium]